MRLGYFGGSFDPPHRGHLLVARAARDRFALDRVLLAPTAHQPLKPHGPEASFADRLRMTELLCKGQPRLEVSAIDGPRPNHQPNYTVDTLRRLLHQFSTQDASGTPAPDTTPSASPTPVLYAILGADAFLTLPHWREPKELLRLADWIVVSRPGTDLSHPHPLLHTPQVQARIHILNGLADSTSATQLRAELQAGTPCGEAIPAAVLQYIHAHHLYTGVSA